MIPRIIHQIYFSDDLPAALEPNVARLRSLNPGWTHHLWNTSEAETFIESSYGREMLRSFHAIDSRYGAVRSDFLRHLLIHEHGGVYFDIKSGCSKPLDQVIHADDHYLLSQWPAGDPCFHPHAALSHVPGGEFVTWFIAATPRHPFSAAMIERMTRNVASYRPWSSVGRVGALKVGGPIAYTLAVEPLLKEQPHRIASFEELGLYYSFEGYDHSSVFKNHYSKLNYPVVQLGPVGRFISRLLSPFRS